MANFSQFAAFKSLMKGSLRSILKSPSSVIFTVAFPLIFIVAFGWMDKGGIMNEIKIGIQSEDSAFNNIFSDKTYWSVEQINSTSDTSIAQLNTFDFLIKKEEKATVLMYPKDLENYRQAYDHLVIILDQYGASNNTALTMVPKSHDQQITKKIDYILPGQLGFSLLAASIFGTAFVFFSLRHTYVLKRFFATPISTISILMAEGFSRLIFQTIGALMLICIGYFIFDLSLPSGILSVIAMLLISILGIISFMSFGFIISGLAKSEATVPPLANIAVLPQFIMSDTFIPIEDMPRIVQHISTFLPLTHFNQAIRAFTQHEIGLIDYGMIGWHVLVIAIWGVIGYFIATKSFKWE